MSAHDAEVFRSISLTRSTELWPVPVSAPQLVYVIYLYLLFLLINYPPYSTITVTFKSSWLWYIYIVQLFTLYFIMLWILNFDIYINAFNLPFVWHPIADFHSFIQLSPSNCFHGKLQDTSQAWPKTAHFSVFELPVIILLVYRKRTNSLHGYWPTVYVMSCISHSFQKVLWWQTNYFDSHNGRQF